MEGFELRRFSFVAKKKKLSKKQPHPKTDSLLSAAWTEIMNGSTVVEGGELVQDVKDDIVMLASKESLQLLQQNNFQVFGDGTFKYAPKGYFQMYTLHILNNNIYTPVVYFLLKNKKQGTYRTMFRLLKSHCPDLWENGGNSL